MSSTPHLDRCAICSGTREEHHSQVKHMFTLNAGELRLPPKVENNPQQKRSDSALVVVSTLVEILLDKEVITQEEALRCYGVNPQKNLVTESVTVSEL